MLDRKALQALGCWTGYRLERVEWPEEGRTLSLYLKPLSKVMHCEQCGARCQQIHETTVRRGRDLPLFEYRVVLHVAVNVGTVFETNTNPGRPIIQRRRKWCTQACVRSTTQRYLPRPLPYSVRAKPRSSVTGRWPNSRSSLMYIRTR